MLNFTNYFVYSFYFFKTKDSSAHLQKIITKLQSKANLYFNTKISVNSIMLFLTSATSATKIALRDFEKCPHTLIQLVEAQIAVLGVFMPYLGMELRAFMSESLKEANFSTSTPKISVSLRNTIN